MAIKLFGKTIKSKTIDKFLSTFNPSESVSAARRKDVFKTESKTGAAIGIGVLAATAYTGGAAVGLAGTSAKVTSRAVVSKVAKATVGKAFTRAPVVSTLVAGTGGTILLGRTLEEPKTITRGVGGLINLEGNLLEFGREPSIENLKDIYQENPVIAGVVTAGLATATVAGASALGNVVSNTLLREEVESGAEKIAAALGDARQAIPSTVPATSATTSTLPTNKNVPAVAQTKTISTGVSKSRKKKRVPQNISQSVRVNILNHTGRMQNYISHSTRRTCYV